MTYVGGAEGELVDLWKNFIDFGIEKDFPEKDFIKENLDEGLLHEKGVYVDEKVTVENKSGIMVLNGKCVGSVMMNGYSVCSVYVRHDCDVNIVVGGMAKVFVHCYDDCKVNVVQKEMGRVFLYMHDRSEEEHEGEVSVRWKK